MLPIRDGLKTRSPAGVNDALVAANVLVMLLELGGAVNAGPAVEPLAAGGALVPAELIAHPIANLPTLVSHQFMHGNLAHLGGNMLFLWIFGDNVEDALGHARYAVFYLTCGIAAALTQVIVTPHATVPMVGASGAISGVLAAYGVLYPRSSIQVVNPVPLMWLFWGVFMFLPAWFVILEYFAANLWQAFQAESGGSGVAFMAHVGGFLAGVALLPLFRKREPVEYDAWERMLRPRAGTGRGVHRSMP